MLRLFGRARDAVGRLAQAKVLDQHLKAFAVLGQVNGVGRGAEDGDTGGLEGGGELERRLPAKLDDDAQQVAIPLFGADQLDDVLGGQGIEIRGGPRCRNRSTRFRGCS